MSLRKSQMGFSAVELVIVIGVVAALALVGYTVYNQQNDKTANTTNSQAASGEKTATGVTSAPAISSTSDLDKASAALDQTDPSSSNNSDGDQLDSQLSSF